MSLPSAASPPATPKPTAPKPAELEPAQPGRTKARRADPRRTMPPGLKFALEMGPLALFLLANFKPAIFEPTVRLVFPAQLFVGKQAGLFTATAVLMVATVAALAVFFAMTRRLPVMPLVTAVLVLVFGGLTLWLHDQSFVQMKPTILYALFGAALLGGLALGRPLLPVMLEQAMKLDERGWRVLTLRWGIFFVALAVLNEIVRHAVSWDHWVLFKFPGTVILIFVFTFAQVPLIMRHELKGDAADRAPEHV